MANRVRITLSGEGESAEKALASVERRMGRVQRETRQTKGEMRSLNRVSSAMTSGFGSLAGAVGVAAGATGLGYLVNSSLRAQEELHNLHKTTGISIERIQEYQFAARKTGIEQQKINDALAEMSQRMGEAIADYKRTGGEVTEMGEGFQAAGISMEQLQRMNPTQTFDQLSRAIQDAKTEQDALNIAAKAFGDDSGQAMVSMLREGEKAIGDYIQQAHELGIILDEEVVKQSTAAKKSITTLTVALESQFSRVVGELAPQISTAANNMADWVSENEDFLSQDVPGHIKGIAEEVSFFAKAVSKIPEPVLYGGLGAVAGGRFGPYGALAGAEVGVAAHAAKTGAEGEQYSAGMVSDRTREQARAQAELNKEQKKTEANLNDLGPLWDVHHNKTQEISEANKMLWESMANLNEGTDKNTDSTERNNRVREKQLSLVERINQQLQTHGDIEQARRAADMAAGRNIGPPVRAADDAAMKEAWRQAQITRDMASPQVSFTTLEGGADDEWARKQMENMDQVGDEAKSTADIMENAFDGWANRFSSQLTDMVWEAEFSFDKILESFGKMVTQMLIQQQMVNLFGEGQSGWGAVGQGLSAIFSAQGNVFSGGHHLQQYAKGGVVDRPTIFPMAQGAGVMGEAGPEAVMPLKRTKGGDLGVQSEGRGKGMQVEFNVYNQSGQPVEAEEESRRFDGEKMILNVVLDAANRNKGGFGKNLKGTLRKY